MSEWKEYKFSELCTITRGASPRPIHSFLSDQGMPWVKISDATSSSSKYIEKTVEKIKNEGVPKSVKVFKGDLILSNSATPGLPKIMAIDACIHDGWMLLRDFRHITKEFAYWVLLNERRFLVHQGTGTVFVNLKTDILKNYKVKIPDISTQNKIVKILNSLDDKIQLNTQTNQTLEQIAQTIYKSWFVDYEPTRAKAAVLAAGGSKADAESAAMTTISGKSAAELATLKQQQPARYQQLADLAAAFPAVLTPTDDFGEIPAGWEIKKVGDIAKIVKGKKPKNIYPSQEDNFLPHILVAALEGKYTEFCETTKMTTSKITDTLVLMDGSASGKISIGHHGVVGSTLAKMELFDDKYWAILYQLLKSKEKDIQDNTTGTSIPHADKARINEYSLSVCEGYILDFYNQFFEKSLFQSIKNRKQSNLLESIRDTILPKLLSGELKQE